MENVWKNSADISWIDASKPMVAFTFDDGPVDPMNETSTAIRIQDVFKENDMHATFFYWNITLNDNTRKEIERAYELGFEIANHTLSHPSLPKLSDDEITREISEMANILTSITGLERFLFRPPYIDINQNVIDLAKAPLITCGVDSRDWAGVTAEEIIDRITKAYEDGSLRNQIVLLHEPYDTTVKAVEYLVPFLKEKGYQFVTISEMFKVNGKDMVDGHIYTGC